MDYIYYKGFWLFFLFCFSFHFWLRLGEQEKPREGGKQEEEELFPFFFYLRNLEGFSLGWVFFFFKGTETQNVESVPEINFNFKLIN